MKKFHKRVTLKMYRQSKVSIKNIFSDIQKPGTVYHEYVETWEQLSEMKADGTIEKRRLAQQLTGRSFKVLDVVSPEYVKDTPGQKNVGDLILTRPEDFMMIRLVKL